MSKSNSKILRPVAASGGDGRNFTVRLPAGLAAELDAVRKAAEAAGLEFPAGEIARDAVARAVTAARRELADLLRRASEVQQ